jgi:hypothetical protein
MQHYLKCWSMYLNEIQLGRKTFEIRSTKDRIFQAGDTLLLAAYNPVRQQYESAMPYEVEVLAVYHELPGLQPGHCLMSIREKQQTSE